MSVLSRKENRDDYRLVGVHVLPPVHNYITLYTLAKGIAKTTLLKQLLDYWIEEQSEEHTEAQLKEMLIVRINEQWHLRKKKHPRASFTEYKEKVGKELLSKGLNKKQVNSILPLIKG
jgi:hypothetical protein